MNDAKYIKELEARCETAVAKIGRLSEERGPHKGAPKLKKLEIGPYDEVYEKGMKWLDENG